MLRVSVDPLPWTLLLIVALVVSASAGSLADLSGRAPDTDAARSSAAAASDCARAESAGPCDGPSAAAASVTLSAAAFQLGSAELPEPLARKLVVIAAAMREQRAVVRIEVHTDASGSREGNRQLSQRRAETIRSFLIEKGIDPYRVQAVGMGASRPKLAADPFAAENRRVEIVRL